MILGRRNGHGALMGLRRTTSAWTIALALAAAGLPSLALAQGSMNDLISRRTQQPGKEKARLLVEGKEIIVNLNTFQVENHSEVFVFQKGNRFIRLPLYQLLLVSDIHRHLQAILQEERAELIEVNEQTQKEAADAIYFLEQENYSRMIDEALSSGDREMFDALIAQQRESQQLYGGL